MNQTLRDDMVLSPQQLTVLRLAWKGHSTKETAALMGLSFTTVKNYRSHIFMKFGVNNVEGMLRRGVELGYIDVKRHEAVEWP